MTPFDVAVLGGGPAGLAAAACATSLGAHVVLIDEQAGPADSRNGGRRRARLAFRSTEFRSAHLVWGLGGGPLVPAGHPARPFRLDTCAEDRIATIEARALILCPGTHERVIPFAGWTLPGVVGLTAATAMLNAQGVVPGRRNVVCGTGPLLAAVAAGILAKGSEVAAIVDAAPRSAWMARIPALARRPAQLSRGAGWVARILAAGVPVLSAHRVVRAHGTGSVTAVDVVGRAGGVVRSIACDAVCVGHGLVPASEAGRVYGARHVYRPARGGWVPDLDDAQRSSVDRLYVAGDAAGIAGSAAARRSGEIAAHAALADLGIADPAVAARAIERLRRAGRGAARFGAALGAMMAPPGDLVDAIPPDCVVCRCEDVTRAEIETACDMGAQTLNQLKHFTRCGMGPCQGRVCGDTAAELLARRVGGREAAGQWTARVPLRPLRMAVLLERFDYADIPVPAPAPI